MGLLEEINYMKNHGMNEQEILSRLQEKGISPREIDDAFNQMKIKNAVSAENSDVNNPSIMTGRPRDLPIPAQSLYIPKTQEIENPPEELYAPQPEGGETQYGTQEEYYPQEQYEESEAGAYDTDTLIEIAEQVFSEKIKKEQKQIESLNEFATLAETQLSNNHERIKRIEAVMDKLQIGILEKIGSYGKNLESIKNEMEMMQDSFGKIIPSLHEKYQEQRIAHKTESPEKMVPSVLKKTSKKKY